MDFFTPFRSQLTGPEDMKRLVKVSVEMTWSQPITPQVDVACLSTIAKHFNSYVTHVLIAVGYLCLHVQIS